jgi:hypothetical protein
MVEAEETYVAMKRLCKQSFRGNGCAGNIQNHENEHVHGIGQGEVRQKNIRGLNLAVVNLMTVQVTKLPL